MSRVPRGRVVDNEFGTVLVQRTRRAVRVTVATKPATNTSATHAFIDLSAFDLDKLVLRLVALRGGKQVL